MKINDIITFYDKILIIIIIIASLLMLFVPFYYSQYGNSENLYLIIESNGEEVKRFPLENTFSEPVVFEIEGPIGIHKIEAYQGKVRVKEAPEDDPLKICEKTGWIEQQGPIIICVPNKISIWIESSDAEVDGMSW